MSAQAEKLIKEANKEISHNDKSIQIVEDLLHQLKSDPENTSFVLGIDDDNSVNLLNHGLSIMSLSVMIHELVTRNPDIVKLMLIRKMSEVVANGDKK